MSRKAGEVAKLKAEIQRLKALINTPEVEDWFKGVQFEAAHQVERFGTSDREGKTPADWFWLVGYLAGKALHAAIAGNVEKLKHHTISTGAALLNWHRAVKGDYPPAMRPGIKSPEGAA